MHQIFPTLSPQLGVAELIRIYDYRRPIWRRSNFVVTLDGATQGPDGRSGSINTASDRQLFAIMRAVCDVVLVGAQTVRQEGYRAIELNAEQKRIRSQVGLAGIPALAVVSRTRELPELLASVGSGWGEVILISDCSPPVSAGVRTLDASHEGTGELDLSKAVRMLTELGYTRLLCEGGPRLHQQLLAAGLIDEICLTTVPRFIGGAEPRLSYGPERLTLSLTPASLIIDTDGTTFARWLLPPSPNVSGSSGGTIRQ